MRPARLLTTEETIRIQRNREDAIRRRNARTHLTQDQIAQIRRNREEAINRRQAQTQLTQSQSPHDPSDLEESLNRCPLNDHSKDAAAVHDAVSADENELDVLLAAGVRELENADDPFGHGFSLDDSTRNPIPTKASKRPRWMDAPPVQAFQSLTA